MSKIEIAQDSAVAVPSSCEVTHPTMVALNVPEWFEDPEFVAAIEAPGVMTWHVAGHTPCEWSDTLLWVDPSLNGDGGEQGTIPDRYWDAIITTLKTLITATIGPHVLVRLTNMDAEA